MAAETADTLTKIDSVVDDASKKGTHRRASSALKNQAPSMEELQEQKKEIKIAPETQKLGWKINTSPVSLDDKDLLKKPLCAPATRKITLHFKHGLEVIARNREGVTIKDALDAIYKQHKKKADDELEDPYLKGFEWDPEESYTRFVVHLQASGGPPQSKKSKKKGGDE